MKYVIKKLFSLIATLLLVSILAFAAFNVIPGDPAQLILGTEATDEQVEVLNEELGLNENLGTRYIKWMGGLLKGDPGNSIKYNTPVMDLIKTRISVTFIMAVLAMVVIITIAVPIGIFTAKNADSLIGKAVSGINMAGISIPNFFLGVLFIWIFGIILNVFSPGEYIDYKDDFFGFLKFIIFPVLAISIPNIAMVVKFLRVSILGELNKDYVKTAYSKGNTDNKVLYNHILKNALIPVITLLGMIVAEIFSGSIIMEQVFQIPGIGRLLISSISSRDFPLVETIVVYIGFAVVIINTIVDIVLQYINPQIKIE